MKKIILQVKNKEDLQAINRLATIVYMSPVLNVVGIEIQEKNIPMLNSIENIISWNYTVKGNLMTAIS
ncbi:hypothetical protein AAGS61_04165 [Lysinibacillus sp. KU-BSD001]|uniref:hypothetical protein n=1 Tax=Lysinibacillus sp. KU-BSD001 TaxID=3141328 RepID=UPI0036EEA15E